MHLREKEMGRGLRSEKERRERYGEVNITELAAEYYFLNFCEGIIRQIEDHSPDYRTHLTFREASEIFSIHQLSARIRRQLTDFFKEYLLLAIRSEVGEVWESVLNLPLNRSLRRDVVSLYESGNSEDILHYIARAHKRFGDFQWILPAFGGPLWAEISKVALKLWRDTETAPDHIIDHIFDLQHNGLVNGSQSYIFDKDPKRVTFYTCEFEELMNVKRDVHTLREFIERSRPYVSKTVADQWEVEFDVLYKIVNHGSLSGGVSSVVGKLGNARSS